MISNPRPWIFCHYDPNVPFGGFQFHAGRWARTKRYKLYNDGRFFDVANDQLEQRAIVKGSASRDAERARRVLRHALDSMPRWVERGLHHRESEQNKKYKNPAVLSPPTGK